MSVISRSMGLALGSARNFFRLRASAIIAQHMYLDTTSVVPSGALGAHPSPALGYAPRFFSSRPPYTELNMPALSPTMEQGNLSKWHVKEGEEVVPGTVLADVETDKATLAFENQEEGFIAKLLVPEGSKDIPVGTPLALLVEEASHVAAFQDFTPGAEASAAAPAASPAVAAAPAAVSQSYPPHQMLGMPALSPTMEQGSIGKWLVGEGAEIEPGQLLVEVETDKATLGLENQDEGFLAKILAPNGSQDIKVGEPIAVIVEDAAHVAAFANFTLASASAVPAAAAPQASSPAVDAAPASGPAPDSRIGPAAQHALDVAGLSKEDCVPTGPHNIVTWHDVQVAIERRAKGGAAPKAAAAPAPAAPSAKAPAAAPPTAKPAPPGSTYEDMPISTIRGIIAKRLTEAKQTVPAIYMSAVANLDSMNSVRSGLKDAGIKVSVNDFVVRAVALALKEVPRANALWDAAKGEAVSASSVDISIAVSTPTGLITPIVFAADGKSVSQIGGEVRDLAKRARDNKLKPEEFQGGSFSISNLGMFGIDSFCAIINPPQACIMAVGGTQERVVLEAGKPVVKQEMTVMLSADNRVYDEELAALFLEAFCNNISNPAKLLA